MENSGPGSILSPETVRDAYTRACLAELAALKPGNVHIHGEGHDMTVTDFKISAQVSAKALTAAGLSPGRRILDATRATHTAVGCNTNLGILLLCAPLIHATLTPGKGGLRQRLDDTLAALNLSDAADAFEAIRLADPAGLGESPRHDVMTTPQVTLLAAMKEAAGFDRIAAQYATGYRDVFKVGMARLDLARQREIPDFWQPTYIYLGFLGHFPDSHIARKYSLARAEEIRALGRIADDDLMAVANPEDMKAELMALDRRLKHEKINPGTSADLTVACLLAADLMDIFPVSAI
ncbi:MAG: triphosphoribosyl-dephospho-CoA synthase [Rhodospirillaceae bacterium]|jgi:triphosphoribosyl-dephospho-CoA synthase|nr:triphosphoribosyl-dephospho-CoA synthase [Rhodospirillaceae bacterium]MBT5753040.1 triphosphoribosyl-dephospho-CoA synthase [Rhodospirillaceae bacterium]